MGFITGQDLTRARGPGAAEIALDPGPGGSNSRRMTTASARRRPEVLAPAGDVEALRAAVKAGADAVYFGLSGFNARARAANFDVAALSATMAELHEHGVRGYVALNTLVFDAEIGAVEAAVRACAGAGADAVIVQDLGVARIVRAIAPDMPIHASTQMTCTDAGSVALAGEIGASRVILARELSLDEIAKVRGQTDVEVEVFVHGALCIAYSGQCLTSEAIGGRSANRGACAQACRLPYEVLVDGELRDAGDRAYLLSPEDLEAAALVPRLVDLGVTSLKIEGRLKGPEYVAATTRLYRAAVDGAMAGSGAGASAGAAKSGGTGASAGAATSGGAGASAAAATSGAVAAELAPLRETALQMFSRGSGPGFLEGVNHQRLVEGRACDHRGLLLGEHLGTGRSGGKVCARVKLSAAVARGDGVLIEGGFAGEGEIGGRVWSIFANGRDVERAEAGREVALWLGPDVRLAESPAGRRVWKTDDPGREKAVLAEVAAHPRRVRLDVRVTGAFEEAARFEAIAETGARAEVACDAPTVRATNGAPVADALRDKLGRLGDTPFSLGDLRVELPQGAMIPPSAINRARRALVEKLLSASAVRHRTEPVSAAELLAAARPPDRAPPPPGLFVLCRTLEQASAAVDAGASGVVLDFLELTGTGNAVRTLRARGGVHITLAPPRIRKPGEEKIDRYLLELGPDALLVRSLGALRDGEGSGVPRVGDFSLNVTNRLSAEYVLSRDLAAFTPSFDLDAAQLAALLDSPFGPFAEVVVHHPMPLFHMEHCAIAALLSTGKDFHDCGRPCDRHEVSLRDRAGMVHPVEADVGCRNTVFHAAAQSAAGVVAAAQKSGVRRFRIELVREKAADVARLVETYRRLIEGRIAPPEVLRALKTEGGYGVVRGSLRVL
jgi:putative protease